MVEVFDQGVVLECAQTLYTFHSFHLYVLYTSGQLVTYMCLYSLSYLLCS
jgi:hypothetical protein